MYLMETESFKKGKYMIKKEIEKDEQRLFQFTLKPIEECALPGETVKSLSWFYLTDSWYSINLGETHLFESSLEWMQKYPGNPLLDYYYIRWLEDFFDILPQITESIPQNLYELINSEENGTEIENLCMDFWEQHEDENENVPEEIEEVYVTALKLLYHGVLDTGFLRFRSLCRFCRINDEMVIHYDFCDQDEDGVPVWSAGNGKYSMSYEKFIREIEIMLDDFFTAMDRQIENAVEAARKNPDKYKISGNKSAKTPDEILVVLQKEQEDRKEYFYKILASVKDEKKDSANYWSEIRQALQQAGVLTGLSDSGEGKN